MSRLLPDNLGDVAASFLRHTILKGANRMWSAQCQSGRRQLRTLSYSHRQARFVRRQSLAFPTDDLSDRLSVSGRRELRSATAVALLWRITSGRHSISLAAITGPSGWRDCPVGADW